MTDAERTSAVDLAARVLALIISASATALLLGLVWLNVHWSAALLLTVSEVRDFIRLMRERP